MSAKHTPTPLFIRHVIGDDDYQIERQSEGLRSIVAHIVDTEICPEHGSAETYTALIVRAVNSHEALLEAAKEALDLLKDQYVPGTVQEKLKAAIAKAEGREGV